ncbi:hypothetical protein K469DRAFT_450414, partial [Zopfia rhizophila CBS 207.26]
LLFLPAPILAAVEGPCSGRWNDPGCICLDHNQFRNRWGGNLVQGGPGDRPCPSNPNNIWGCYVVPCPGKDSRSYWSWRNRCTDAVLPGTDPVCPGGNDFVCC